MNIKQLIKPALVILGILVVAIAAGVIIALTIHSRTQGKRVTMTTMEMPRISAKVLSSTDGSEHRVTMNLYFELGEDLFAGISLRESKKQLEKIVSTMDYDKLVTGDSIGYVTEYIISRFSEDIDRSEIGSVYVSDIVTGDMKFFSADAEAESQPKQLDVRTQQRFDALFSAD